MYKFTEKFKREEGDIDIRGEKVGARRESGSKTRDRSTEKNAKNI